MVVTNFIAFAQNFLKGTKKVVIVENNLRKFRIEEGLTQKQLGLLADLSDRRVGAIENGVRGIRETTKQRLVDALNTNRSEAEKLTMKEVFP